MARAGRRVWARDGRAYVEARGLHDPDVPPGYVDALESTLAAIEGVRWAAVNGVLGDVIVAFDDDRVGVDRATGNAAFVQVPRHVVLEWPQQKFVMELKLAGEKVNEDLSDRAVALFTRPRIPGTNPIDLARYEFRPAGYRGQAPAEPRSRRWR